LEGGLKWDIIKEKKVLKQALLALPGESIMIPPPSIIAGYTKDYQKRKHANM
jgi:hypothetical protein